MKIILTIFSLFLAPLLLAVDSDVVFTARMTDRDDSLRTLKMSSENSYTRFFKKGDALQFHLPRKKDRRCDGFIKGAEEGFFVVSVKNLDSCWDKSEYFRRGTLLTIYSPKLRSRVFGAKNYKLILKGRRDDHLKQLNEINHFIWSYDQQRIQLAASFDEQIIAIEKERQEALRELTNRKRDSTRLQQSLTYQLDKLEKDLSFYNVEKEDLLVDKQHLYDPFGLPIVKKRK